MIYPEQSYCTSDQPRVKNSKSKITVQHQPSTPNKMQSTAPHQCLNPSTETLFLALHLHAQSATNSTPRDKAPSTESDQTPDRCNETGPPMQKEMKASRHLPNANENNTQNKKNQGNSTSIPSALGGLLPLLGRVKTLSVAGGAEAAAGVAT